MSFELGNIVKTLSKKGKMILTKEFIETTIESKSRFPRLKEWDKLGV